MSSAKKIGLFACTGVVAGNMMGSGIALLPANLASIGGIAIWGWVISIIGAMSLANYVLLGKVYEMKGANRQAADAYLTAFNLRPGENTLYWIENGVFQTSVTRVVPYLNNFLSSE
ncbi:hypothetical protein GM30_05225 [Trabulsiella odontotermitis]|nr:hypothetical protein GM30_05225 [Trabulsiella odontotermitis]